MTHQTPSVFIIPSIRIPLNCAPRNCALQICGGLLCLLCGLFPPSSAQAQATQQAQAPDNTTLTVLHERVTTFLGALGERTTARRAVEQIVEGGPLEQQTNTTRLIEQVEQFSSRYGLYLESERVASRTVGRDLVMLTYLYKTDQFPVIWRFTFYRPPTPGSSGATWRVVAISFDTNYQLLELSVGEDGPSRLEP